MARRLRLAATMASAAALFAAIGPAAAQTPATPAPQTPATPATTTQAPDAVPGELIVRFEPTVGEAQREDVRERVGAELEEKLPVKGLELVDLDPGTSIAAAERSFERQSDVLYAEPNFYRRASATTNDRFFGELWGLNNTGQKILGVTGTADADIDAPEAWDVTTGSALVTVAVVDTGVAYDHQDLAGNAWTNTSESAGVTGVDDDANGKVDDVHGWDFAGDDPNVTDPDPNPADENGHGTHVAGTVGARGNDGYGVAGVARDVSLMPVRVLDSEGSGSVADVIAGYRYAARNGADVVNASLGGGDFTQSELEAIQDAPSTLFVVAAGNDAQNNESASQFPCNYTEANVICVAATDSRDELASFSNYGSTSVDLAAPGKSTLSSYPSNVGFLHSHAYLSGTSMATPHAAGVAALILAANPAALVPELRQRLLNSVDVQPCLVGRTVTGGRLNANAALGPLQATPQPVSGACQSPTPAAAPTMPAEPAAPPGAPPAPQPATSAPTRTGDESSPRMSVSVRARQRLSRVLAAGLQPVVRCSEACRISTDVLVDRPTAKRLAVRSVIGRASAGLSRAGGRKVAVRLTSAAKRRLARAHLVTLTLRTRGVDRAGNARTVTKRLSLRR